MRVGLAMLLLATACEVGPEVPPVIEANERPSELDDPSKLPVLGTVARGHIGVISASESVDVPSRIDGIIETVYVNFGDAVKAGDPIAKLDERPMQEQLAIAKAEARRAGAQARRAGVAARTARAQARRRKELGAGVLSKEDIEGSASTAAQASASRSEASAAASAERTRVAQLERMLTETTITAPFAGKIADTFRGPGENVVRGTPVARLIAADELRVDFVFPLEDEAVYDVGDEIKILLEGSDTPIKGIVRRIAPDLDPVAQMVTAQAELSLEKDQRKLIRTGMGVWVNPAKEKVEPKELN